MRIDGWNGEIGGARWWSRAFAFAAALGVLLGVIGPFGIYVHSIWLRLLDQVGMTVAGTAIAGLLIPVQLRIGLKAGLPRPLVLAAAILTTALPIAGLSALVATRLWPQGVARYGVSDWYLQAVLMLTCVVGLWLLLEKARHVGREPSAAPAASVPAHRAALCLQMEDNYVRVHRDQGSSLELMPLREAIGRFGHVGGLQVHRGWWVAAEAVEGAERDGRNWRLRLRNGMRVPVARNRVAAARAKGWIA